MPPDAANDQPGDPLRSPRSFRVARRRSLLIPTERVVWDDEWTLRPVFLVKDRARFGGNLQWATGKGSRICGRTGCPSPVGDGFHATELSRSHHY